MGRKNRVEIQRVSDLAWRDGGEGMNEKWEKVLADWLKVSKEDGDTCWVIWPGDRGRIVHALKKGDATEGAWAFMINIGTKALSGIPQEDKSWKRYNGYDLINASSIPWERIKPGYLANIAPPEKFTATAESAEGTGYSAPGAKLEHAAENHAYHCQFYTAYTQDGVIYTPGAFTSDWTGYRYLRMDVKPQKGKLSFRMAFEDNKVVPPVEKRFIVEGGQWSTAEIDLEQAVKERQVDLSKVANLWVFLEELTEPGVLLIDNVRLSKAGVAAKQPVVSGGPKVPRPTAPMPKADTSAVKKETGKLTLGEPAKIESKSPTPAGVIRLWGYDNDRLVVMNGEIFYTLDGGATWRTLKRDFRLPGGVASNPQAATDMDAQGNIGFFGHCFYHCGPPADSTYFRKLVFTGAAWVPSPLYIVGGETRCCQEGRRWSEPQRIATALMKDALFYSIATANDRDIYIGTSRGLIHWDGKEWKDIEKARGLFLTMCGRKVVGFSVEKKGEGSAILFWHRVESGDWISSEIASEDMPIWMENGERSAGSYVAIPKHSPDNYAPVAWSCKGATWVKVLRVPVEP